MKHEKDIDDILASLDDAQRAEAGPYFYSKVRARLQDGLLPRRLAWRLGLALLLVALLNVATLRAGRQEAPVNEGTAQAIASEYSLTLSETY
ncbi:hypothetical protein [Flaviaesturariibacter aridisoli]|uniref:Uncharacterized protein n=1 Tax=Flaviaesturariibacter aridisoli TaxID=2545761 RepID=A0A4R4DZE2_9BACT|nr:hypothetical protein [Flaviaesturariibacter aridisoli]TCZ71751.1 hypothetical protein E0486_09360 [Flaviaesturariibacter aridisoli]